MTLLQKNNSNINYLFDELFNLPNHQPKNPTLVPANIYETASAFQVEINAPGRHKANFKLLVEKGLLTISYEASENNNEKEQVKTVRREFITKNFKRSFAIDDTIATENITASYENGILNLHLPKKQATEIAPKEIAIA